MTTTDQQESVLADQGLAVEPDLDPVEDAARQPEAGLPDDRFLNREVSWLDFNARVLALARDPRTPLLERAKFLAIFASNLDEFFMVRVAGLKRRQSMGLGTRSADGLGTREQLALHQPAGARAVAPRTPRASWRRSGRRSPTSASGSRCGTTSPPEQQAPLHDYFRSQLFPVLTPLAVDPAHPFPYISGLSLNLAVLVREPAVGRRALRPGQGAQQRQALRAGRRRRQRDRPTCRSRS